MKKIVLLWALPVFLLAGCQSEKDSLSKLWFYTYNTGSADPRDTLLTPARPNQFTTEAENPFPVKNNRWRIHPDAKETDRQITTRLSNHFGFWIAYFTWALDNNIQYVDVRSTPTDIKIYGNGFGLKPFEQLPAAWKSYFYDAEDCRRANAQVERLFDNNSIAWPQTDNKFKFFISAFQQLKQKI